MKLSDYTTLSELSKLHQVNYHTLRYRLRKRKIKMTRKAGVLWIARKDVSREAVSK